MITIGLSGAQVTHLDRLLTAAARAGGWLAA
jgi:hypothetical protein